MSRVALFYDDRVTYHEELKEHIDEPPHIEKPDRVTSIMDELRLRNLTSRCQSNEISTWLVDDQLLSKVHGLEHIEFMKSLATKTDEELRVINKKIQEYSLYVNGRSDSSARAAVACTIEAVNAVIDPKLSNTSAFAIVRPPGHHAMSERNVKEPEAQGFCFYNNVAIATKHLQEEHNYSRIAIIDWDVHHGNGTQSIFYSDPRVLFFSVHRHGKGFYPAPYHKGDYKSTGEGAGSGYNINVPFQMTRLKDEDYTAVWDHILLPILRDFNPEIIFISAGFDSALGDAQGDFDITPPGYAFLLRELSHFADGKIVAVLEGGYDLPSLKNSVAACVESLLGDEVQRPTGTPSEAAMHQIDKIQEHLCGQWGSLWAGLVMKRKERLGPLIGLDVKWRGKRNRKVPAQQVRNTGWVVARAQPLTVAWGKKGTRGKKKTNTEGPLVGRKAGLVFPVGRVRRYMRRALPGRRLTVESSVAMTAVLQYVTKELLYLAGDVVIRLKKEIIKPEHLQIAIKNDWEFNQLVQPVIIPLSR